MIDAIRLEYPLACSAEDAFAVYTGRIGEWWHPRYTRDPKTLRSVTIEPFVGGRVFATHSDGRDVWGEVQQWEPGRLLVHSFWLAHDPVHPSEVSVEFAPAVSGCRMEFSHGGWDEANAVVRGKFGDWPVMLERMIALVAE